MSGLRYASFRMRHGVAAYLHSPVLQSLDHFYRLIIEKNLIIPIAYVFGLNKVGGP